MAKEIKKGSKEAKKIFEGYKKRLEAGENLKMCWLKESGSILTDEQKKILADLDIGITRKETEEIKKRNAVYDEIIANPFRFPTKEEENEKLLQDLLERIKDLPKEKQEEKIAFHYQYIKARDKAIADQIALDESLSEEDEMVANMTREEFHEYFMSKFARGREYIKKGKFADVNVLESNKKGNKK